MFVKRQNPGSKTNTSFKVKQKEGRGRFLEAVWTSEGSSHLLSPALPPERGHTSLRCAAKAFLEAPAPPMHPPPAFSHRTPSLRK